MYFVKADRTIKLNQPLTEEKQFQWRASGLNVCGLHVWCSLWAPGRLFQTSLNLSRKLKK